MRNLILILLLVLFFAFIYLLMSLTGKCRKKMIL